MGAVTGIIINAQDLKHGYTCPTPNDAVPMTEEHPLVFRFGAFGDMVLITPMLRMLSERCGRGCDVIGTGAWCQDIFKHMPYVREVMTIPSRSTPYLLSPHKQKLARLLRERDYRYVWMLEQNKHSYKLAEKAGITDTVNANDIPRGVSENMAAHWCRMALESPEGFDHPSSEIELNSELFVSDEELEDCRSWLKSVDIDPQASITCIQPGNKKTTRAGRVDRQNNTKYWHQRCWAEVLDAITESCPEQQIIICGVPAERAMSLDIHALCRDKKRIYCAAGELPMRRLLALLSMSHSCISVDTGPAHAAAALDCDLTVLFAKADARLYSPVSTRSRVVPVYGRVEGTELLDTPESWAECHDISLITPEQVFNGWKDSGA